MVKNQFFGRSGCDEHMFFVGLKKLLKTAIATASVLSVICSGILFSCIGYSQEVSAEETSGDFVIEDGVLREYKGSGGNVVIPEGVTEISYKAFGDCSSLTGIEIPKGVTKIWGSVFSGCSNLTSITVDSGNKEYDSRNNCNAIIETGSNILVAGCKNTVIPDDVTGVGDGAFDCCSGLTGIEIPEGVRYIDGYAFYNCEGLTSVNIPSGLSSIGRSAFSGCSGLTSVSISSGVESIGDAAFNGCSSLTIYGEAGSSAESYAKEYGIPFKTGKAPENPEPGFITKPGNADLKGDVDLDDVMIILKAALGIEDLAVDSQEFKNADIDNDGTITLDDCIEVLKIAIGID